MSSERFRGVLLGTFVGDALGYPFEGTPLSDLGSLGEAVDRRVAEPLSWGYSDDTETTVGVAESLIECERLDARHLLATLARNYDPARGYGKGMKLIVRALENGAAWDTVASTAWPAGSRGNGGAVRVGPIACLFHDDVLALDQAVVSATRITHAAPAAIHGALVLARAIAHLLRLPSPERLRSDDLLDDALAALPAEETLYRNKLGALRALLGAPHTTKEVVEVLGNDVLAEDSVPIAIHSMLSAPRDFAEIVKHAVKLGGDTDTIGAMTGAMAGALFGEPSIPPAWLDALENRRRGRDHVRLLGDQLFATWRKRAPSR